MVCVNQPAAAGGGAITCSDMPIVLDKSGLSGDRGASPRARDAVGRDTVARCPRVGFFVSSLGDMGGAVRVAVSLANRMVRDYRVTIYELTDHDALAFPLADEVRVCALRAKEPRIRGRISEVRALLGRAFEAHPCDVLFGVGVEETSVAIRPCKDKRVALVFCDHGALVNQLGDKSTTLLRFACALSCAKTVVLTTQTLADYRRIFRIREGKLACVPNWIDGRLFEGAELSHIENKAIVWAGRLDAEKGPDLLFDIAKRLAPRNPDWHIDVYGSRVLADDGFDLERSVAEAGLGSFVRLRGRYKNVADVFPRYSIGVLTSYREGLPLFLLEGMAFGLPLVSFDVDTGPRDLIDDGRTGRLIAPYDCEAYACVLQELMESEEMRRRMSQAAREKAQDFLEDNIYPLWQQLVGELAGRRA